MDMTALLQLCRRQGAAIATVESCTGGMIAEKITDISGSSEVFWGGWAVYDNSAKTALGLSPELILRHGAVSMEVAADLARAGLMRIEAALADAQKAGIRSVFAGKKLVVVSTTGIAGPGGGTADKPVGLCYIGLAVSGQAPRSLRFQAAEGADRARCREDFSTRALEWIGEILR